MNFIAKNYKKAVVFNTILIVITLILQVCQMCISSYTSAYECFNEVVIIVALISGLLYAFYGYKKDAAKYYKAFMILTLIAFVSTVISHLQLSYLRPIAYIAFVRLIPIALLAFKKDFGKRNSEICAYLTFALTLIIVLIGPFIYANYPLIHITMSINNVLLSAIVIIFVEEKYLDKAERGTK